MKVLLLVATVIAAIVATTATAASDPASRCAIRTGGAPNLLGGTTVQGWFQNLCTTPASSTTEHACLNRTLNANQTGIAIVCKTITTGSTGGTVTLSHRCALTSIIYIWYISGYGTATFNTSKPYGTFQSPTIYGPGRPLFCS